MRVVVSVQAKSGSSRGLVHYIAHSKTDTVRGEPKTREIFSDYSDRISVKHANEFLKNGISNKRVSNTELHHLVISLRAEDFSLLGENETERQNSLKNITRNALKTIETHIGAERLSWAAGIHRNTDNPHVHIALQKTFFDKNQEKQILAKIPREILPHYEKKGEKSEKVFVSGLLIGAANQKLEEIIKEKQQVRQKKAKETKLEKRQKSLTEKAEETSKNLSQNLLADEKNLTSEIQSEREILARAILAKFHLEKTKENLESLTDHGDKRRFKIYDHLTGKHRRLSLFDLERRAEKEFLRKIKPDKITNPAKKESLKNDFVKGELEKNSESVGRIKTILHGLIRKDNQTLKSQETAYKEIKPLAEKIRQKYRRDNEKLPVPVLSREDLEMLQNAALEKGEIRTANYFERVRKELASERGEPVRTEKELKRLKAKQFVSNLKVRVLEKQAEDFADNRRAFPFEIEGKKWSLLKIDSFIATQEKQDQKITGKISKALSRFGVAQNKNDLQKLEEIRLQVLDKLDEKSAEFSTKKTREESISKTLNEFCRSETSPDKENLPPEFGIKELAEIESFAFILKDAEVYRENWILQKNLIESFPDESEKKFSAEDKQKLIAGRSLAREILCRIELDRAKEELKNFKQHKQVQKFDVTDKKTGEIKRVSLSEVELHLHGSILNQTLDFFLESADKRQTRKELQAIVKAKESALKENYKAARNLERCAATEAKDYKIKSLFGAEKLLFEPVFTPKELAAIEIRIKQTENKSEAQSLQKIFDSAVEQENSKNLSSILSKFSSEKIYSESKLHNLKQKETILESPERGESVVEKRDQRGIGAEINQPDQKQKVKSLNSLRNR